MLAAGVGGRQGAGLHLHPRKVDMTLYKRKALAGSWRQKPLSRSVPMAWSYTKGATVGGEAQREAWGTNLQGQEGGNTTSRPGDPKAERYTRGLSHAVCQPSQKTQPHIRVWEGIPQGSSEGSRVAPCGRPPSGLDHELEKDQPST